MLDNMLVTTPFQYPVMGIFTGGTVIKHGWEGVMDESHRLDKVIDLINTDFKVLFVSLNFSHSG